MTCEARILANRRNAEKSMGPPTWFHDAKQSQFADGCCAKHSQCRGFASRRLTAVVRNKANLPGAK